MTTPQDKALHIIGASQLGQIEAAGLVVVDAAALRALLGNVGDLGHCRGCKAEVWWIEHRNGRKAPYTAAGLNHFADCPAAASFKAKKDRAADGSA